ncbi:MipA/OmpV family protein [Uliginosibacterium sp. sgz301328]|uniref:MipA/OmpV family protein n=1 Tax=Uliginosibacterium sp. sgz301328 TaxID=3243764 RepID=UPI00359ED8FB
MITLSRRLPALALTLALPWTCATAAELPKWEIGFGALALTLPDYRGSSEQRGYVLPLPYFVYRGRIVRADRDGARAELYDRGRLNIELSLAAGVPVRSSDNPTREGMPDLAPTVEFGPQAIIRLVGERNDPVRLDLRLPVRQVLAVDDWTIRNAGVVFTPSLALRVRHGGWDLGLSGGPYFGNQRQNRYAYQVKPEYARPDRPAYDPDAGYGGMQATISLTRRFNTFWIGGFVRASTVRGAVFEDSPLVTRKENYSAGLGISWFLWRSSERVSIDD